MIKVILRGGLGNQMFQYALGYALAEKNNVPLFLDTTLLNDRFPRRNFTFRTFDLDIFTIEPRFTLFSKISKKIPIPGLWTSLDLGFDEIKNIVGIQALVKEKNPNIFDPTIMDIQGNTNLWGFWQTEKYFVDYKEKIRNAFQFKYPLGGVAKDLAKEISSINSVSLHVRRGDYITHKNIPNTLSTVKIPYYNEAAKYIAQHSRTPHFFVFSDDIEWCKKNIILPFPLTYVGDELSGPKASWHLKLMSLCKQNIIANSTFSWWGAWLNNNPGKIVIAPKHWRTGGSIPMNDIIPEGWIRI